MSLTRAAALGALCAQAQMNPQASKADKKALLVQIADEYERSKRFSRLVNAYRQPCPF